MAFVLDRFEENLAVIISLDTEEEKNIPSQLLPKEAKEGDVLRLIDNKWAVDMEKTLERKKLIDEKFNSLWD